MSEHKKSNMEIKKDMENIMEDVKELKSTVYGNGNKGLKERVTIVETNIATSVESIKFMGTILGIINIITGIAISIVMVIINAAKAH